MSGRRRWMTALLAVAVATAGAWATERTWQGPAGGDWFDGGNWTGGDGLYPQADDSVILPSGASVLLTNESAVLASFSITNATLTFSNWTTRLRATEVTIANNGSLTLPGAFTEEGPSNRVWVVCTNLHLRQGGSINADACGYAGRNGPGKGASTTSMHYPGGGAGYGGKGGYGAHADSPFVGVPGIAYGVANVPAMPGSGGGSYYNPGGMPGGGAVRVEALGTVTVDGVISADGQNASGNAGAGSGGSIYITCHRFAGGTNGWLRVDGGEGVTPGSTGAGGGGGGRIAVEFSELAATVGVRFSADYGQGYRRHWSVNRADAAQFGTLYLSEPACLDRVVSAWDGVLTGLNGWVFFASTNTWDADGLVEIRDCSLGVPESHVFHFEAASGIFEQGVLLGEASQCHVGMDMTVSNACVMVGDHAEWIGDGDLMLTHGASLILNSAETNGIANDYGVRVTIGQTLQVASNCWIYPVSHATDGGSPLLQARDLVIARYGGINANGFGFAAENGPGKGVTSSSTHYSSGGGGYGGRGGTGYDTDGGGRWAAGGVVYGNTNAPMQPGSGGGRSGGGAGGGLIRIGITNAFSLDGALTANGAAPVGNRGPGSGGGIYVTCGSFNGTTNSVLQAIGANGATNTTEGAGGGGGGRIAVWIGVSDPHRDQYLSGTTKYVLRDETNRYFAGALSVAAGSGWENPSDANVFPAEAGTAFFFRLKPVPGLIFMVR